MISTMILRRRSNGYLAKIRIKGHHQVNTIDGRPGIRYFPIHDGNPNINIYPVHHKGLVIAIDDYAQISFKGN